VLLLPVLQMVPCTHCYCCSCCYAAAAAAVAAAGTSAAAAVVQSPAYTADCLQLLLMSAVGCSPIIY
jgi:hypothetical protein